MQLVTYPGPDDDLQVGDKFYPRDVPTEATEAEVKALATLKQQHGLTVEKQDNNDRKGD
jgi:hypothetical protein